MVTRSVAIVGAGDPEVGRTDGVFDEDGFSVAYRHAPCYQRRDDCELVAVADVDRDNAAAFADYFDLPSGNTFESYRTMLEAMDVDVVDVCTPVSTHADIVTDCARAGDVSAIHCEKPMADTWGACRSMAEVCERQDVRLTVNHQRRFGSPFRKAKELLDDGEIGELQRVEFGTDLLFTYGSHSFDLCGFFNDDHSPSWVLAAIDYSERNPLSGDERNEDQAVVQWQYENGVYGLAATGKGAKMVDSHHRLVGTDGVVEVAPVWPRWEVEEDLPFVRVRSDDGEWRSVECGPGGTGGLNHGYPYMERSIDEVMESLSEGRPSSLGVDNALDAMQMVFGTYESVRARGRVDFPLTVEDNPLESMLDSGTLRPE